MSARIRNFQWGDLEALVALINACDAVDKFDDGTSPEETERRFKDPILIPTENVFVAEEDDGRVVAHGQLWFGNGEDESVFRTFFQVHPIRRGRGLEERMLAHLYARAEERLGEALHARVNFYTFTNALEEQRNRVIERSGLREVRRSWLMLRDALENIPAPQFPTGLIIRTYRMGADDMEAHAALNDAFRDHWGFVEDTLEQWRHFISGPNYKPELSAIAEDAATGRIAGYCHVTINAEEIARLGCKRGWIDILGVRREYRQRGLGTALLLQGLLNLRAAGMAQAQLGADSENLTGAVRLYERAGFKPHRTWITWRKPIRVETRIEMPEVMPELVPA
jgi:mycothiol synthase